MSCHILKSQSRRAKRTHAEVDDDDDLLMLGIVTNAESWIFVQLDGSGKVYSKSSKIPAGIDGARPADERDG